MPLRRLSTAVSGRLRRGMSTAAWRPPWAMLHKPTAKNIPGPRATLRLAEPPCVSRLIFPVHLLDNLPHFFGGIVKAASGDGYLLLTFVNLTGTAAVLSTPGALRGRLSEEDVDVTRFVCNPLSGELSLLPDIDGTMKTVRYSDIGILTDSPRPHQPPRRYAVTALSNRGEDNRSFVMQRFLSHTGRWDKQLLVLPFPLGRRMEMDIGHEAVAFAGRLWWVDVARGALSVDPFSDRPELRFVELPRGSVVAEPVDRDRREELCRYRRVGVSEGRLRYVEVSREERTLSSFALDDDGSGGWALEHRVPLHRVWANEDLAKDNIPQIAVVDPLNARVLHLMIGKHAKSIDIDGNLLGLGSLEAVGEGDEPEKEEKEEIFRYLKPCVLPPWLESSKIPSSGTPSRNKGNVKGNSLSDILVRADRDKKN